MSKPETPGERIQRLRLAAGLTLTDLADKAGVSVGTVWNLENSVGDTQLSTLQKLCKALKINLSDLDL